jgi:hypothetical protein
MSDDPFWVPDKKPEPEKPKGDIDPFWLPPDWEPPYDPRIRIFKDKVIIGIKGHVIEREPDVPQDDFVKMWLATRKLLIKRGSLEHIKKEIRKQQLEPMKAFRRMAGIPEDEDEIF